MSDKHLVMKHKHLYLGQKVQVEYFEETNDGIPFHPTATVWRNKDDE